MLQKNYFKKFIILGLILGLLAFSARFSSVFGFNGLINFLKLNPIIGALIYVVYAIISVVIITLPIVPLWPVTLYIYPFWVAFILSFLGQVIGALVNFWLARKFGKPFVTKMMGKKLFNEVGNFINFDNPKTFFLVRFFGSNYFDPISYIAGLSRMSFQSFTVTTAITCGAWLIIMLSLINRLGGLENMNGLLSVMGVYGGFILAGTIIWKFYRKRLLRLSHNTNRGAALKMEE